MTKADTDRFWILLFLGYYAFHAVYRVVLGGNLGLDEAQALVEAQRLAWGYGAQPPLYDWLQWGAFRLLGSSLLALSLMKNLLLAGTFLSVYALLRSAHPPRIAGLATASLLLLPQISWESQRALTHSVLATTLAAASVLLFWTRLLGPRRDGYPLFGLATGLGLIAKANFAFVPAALLLAAASSGELRPRLRPGGLLLAAAVAAAVVAAPVAWMLAHPEIALGSAHKFERAAAGTARLVAAGQGLGSLLRAAAGFLLLLLLAVAIGLLRWRFHGGARTPAPELDRFLMRLVSVGLALVALAVLVADATNVKDRWLQPMLFLAAPAATLWLLRRGGEGAARWLGRLLGVVAALVVMVLPVHLVTGLPGSPARGDAPIARLASELAPEATTGPVLADPQWLAGNLLRLNPDWQVTHWEDAAPVSGPALLVWPDEPERGAKIAAALSERAGRPLRLGAARRLAAPYGWQPDEEFVLFAAPLGP